MQSSVYLCVWVCLPLHGMERLYYGIRTCTQCELRAATKTKKSKPFNQSSVYGIKVHFKLSSRVGMYVCVRVSVWTSMYWGVSPRWRVWLLLCGTHLFMTTKPHKWIKDIFVGGYTEVLSTHIVDYLPLCLFVTACSTSNSNKTPKR